MLRNSTAPLNQLRDSCHSRCLFQTGYLLSARRISAQRPYSTFRKSWHQQQHQQHRSDPPAAVPARSAKPASVLPPLSAFAAQQQLADNQIATNGLGWSGNHHDTAPKAAAATARHATTAPSNQQREATVEGEVTASDAAARQHFYRNRVLERYAERPAQPVTLRQLVFFGRTLDEEKLIKSANYVRTELPVRLAHQIREFQRLPYIVGINRHIAAVYGLYWRAFDALRRVPHVANAADNREFCAQLEATIREHLVVIPQLAMGIRESRQYFTPGAADQFMNYSLRSRVSRRVLAEQHLALTRQFNEEGRPAPDGRFIGLIDSRCQAGALLARCVRTAGHLTRQEFGLPLPRDSFHHSASGDTGRAPERGDSATSLVTDGLTDHIDIDGTHLPPTTTTAAIHQRPHSRGALSRLTTMNSAEIPGRAAVELDCYPGHNEWRFTDSCDEGSDTRDDGRMPAVIADGHLSTLFACIPDHVEYALHELLRNAMRATLHQHASQPAGTALPPIYVTVAEGASDMVFRVSDQGGGLSHAAQARLWRFGSDEFRAFETVPRLAGKVAEEAEHPQVRLGIGLLLARVYAEYWGGSLEVQSMPGWGVDAHLRVSKLGNRMENLQRTHCL